MASSLPAVPASGPKGPAESPARRLSLPIPKRRGPPSCNDVLHPMYFGAYGQCAGWHGQAHKCFGVVSPSHSSDASTIDEREEAPASRGSVECQPAPRQHVLDIMLLYQLGQLIGTGSQSFVYQCHWTEGSASPSSGPLCIKHIVGDSSREALTVACEVVHPNVARHFATYDDWRGLWVLMEYVRGPDLAAYLQRVGRLSETASKSIFKQLICALECIHSHNLVHQDVKLENIVVRETSKEESKSQERSPTDLEQCIPSIEIALVDFGSAEVVTSHQRINNKPEFSPAGTAMYMAPEAFLESPVDYKSDIWSAGILLCLLLTGRSPFEGQSIMHTLGRSHKARNSCTTESERRQAVSLQAGLSRPTVVFRERKRRPLQLLDPPNATDEGHRSEGNFAGDTSSSCSVGPEAVRERLMEAFACPEWTAVSAEAKTLISEMLTVDACSRPSAAAIMKSTWLMSP